MATREVSASLKVNEALARGEELRSASGRYALRVRADGEVTLTGAEDEVLWTAGTAGTAVVGVRVQADGDLVAFAPDGAVVWAASRHGCRCGAEFGAGALVVQDDGDLVVRDAAGAARWATRTQGADAGPLALTSFAVLLETR